MDSYSYIRFSLLALFSFLVFSSYSHAAQFSAAYNSFTISNTIIDVGQISVANTAVSGGSGGPYSGQWSWITSNEVNNNVLNSITIGSTPSTVAFNSFGTLAYVLAPGSYELDVINVATNSVVNTIYETKPDGLAVNPSGTLAYVSSQLGTVNVIDLATNTVINTILQNVQGDLAFNPSGTLVYTGSYNTNLVNVIDVATNTVVNTINVGAPSYGVAFNPSGTLVYFTNYYNNEVSVINVASNAVVNTINVGSNPYALAINPSGTLAYVINQGGSTASVIQLSSNTVVNTIFVGSSPIDVAFNPSGTLAYVTLNAGEVNVIDVATNTVSQTITISNTNPNGVAFNPSGAFAYISAAPDQVYLIGNLPETSLQEIPSSGLTQLTTDAVSSNTLTYTFNGITYSESTGQNTIYGQWTLYGFAQDNGTNLYYYGSNTVTLSNTITIDPAPSSTTPLPSNVMLDSGQYVTYNTILSGGTGPFTVNLMNGGTVVNTIIEPAGFSGTITFGSNIPVQGAQTFNIIATDTGTSTPFVSNSISNTIEVNPDLSTPTISASNTLVDAGQYVNFAAYETGGTLPYTYNFIVYNSVTNIQVANMLTSSNSFLWQANGNAGNTLVANVFVTDSASTQVTVNSLHTSTITVNSVLQTPTISASNTLVDTAQYVNFAAYETGGTLPYTYNFIVYNSVTNIQVANMLTSSNSFLWQANGNAGNTLVANVFVSDHASISVTMNSLHSSQIVAYSTPVVSLTVQTGSGIATNSILYGNSVITTAAVTGGSGTGNFIYAFTLDNAEAQNTVSSTTLSSTNTLNSKTIPGNYVFNVIVTDTGTTTHYSVPQVTNTVVIESNDLLSATSSGNPGFAGFYSAVNITFTGTPTIGNQSAWSLYVNGVLFGKTDSVMHWTEQGSPGTYSFTFTNPGNSNYTSASLTSTLKVGSLGTGGSGVSSSSPPPSTIPPTTVPATSIPATSVVSTTTSIPTTTPPASTTSTIPPLLNSSVTSATVSANSSATIPAVINFGNSGAVIKAYSASQTPARIMLTISNASGSVKLAAGLYAVSVLNISSNSQLSRIDVNVSYPCSLPSNSVAPYMFVDGAWQKLANYTVNPSTCTVEVPSAHAGLIAVLSSASKPISLSTILLAVIAAMAIAFIAYIIHLKKLRSKPYK